MPVFVVDPSQADVEGEDSGSNDKVHENHAYSIQGRALQEGGSKKQSRVCSCFVVEV